MVQNSSVTSLTINFLNVEERPLMDASKAWILTLSLLAMLLIGLFIQARIFFMLSKQGSDGSMIAIDRLFKAHNYVNMTCQPLMIIYITFSQHIYPMVDYIGLPGCAIFSHFLNAFCVIYYLIFPLTVAIVRFLFIVFSNWVKQFGINRLINFAIILTLLVPFIMTLSIQYPVSDFIHGPFNHCRGRFEVYFNPTHPDPLSPGRREGERHCVKSQRWAFESQSDEEFFPQPVRIAIFVTCKISRNLFYLLSLSLPEMILYPSLFVHIWIHNKNMASAGILQPDVLQRRRKQNLTNIYMTFWAWLIQFITNIALALAVKFLLSSDLFTFQLIAFSNLFLNFNVMPFIYIILANDSFKKAFVQKKFGLLLKMLFTFET